MTKLNIEKFLEVENGFSSEYLNCTGTVYGSGYGTGDEYEYERGSSGFGFGLGSGHGYGYKDGHEIGFGSGWGCVSGDGSEDGTGYGSGDDTGYGTNIKSFNNKSINVIDGLQTMFLSIHKQIAKTLVLNDDFTTKKCYMAKENRYFAHGETIKETIQSLQKKIFDNLDVNEKIEMFMKEFEIDKKYPVVKFFEWHNKLTGSCKTGRETFVYNNNIDLENDEFTVQEFISLTENEYGGEIIKQIKEELEVKEDIND